MKFFDDKEVVSDPEVLIRTERDDGDFDFSVKKLEGAFYQVVPSIAREILFLNQLKKNVFKYTPPTGDGLIVTLNVL